MRRVGRGRKRSLIAVALTIACTARDAPAPRWDSSEGATSPVSEGVSASARSASAEPGSAGASSTHGLNPFLTHAVPPEQRRWLEGAVEERIVAGSYVYLRLSTSEPGGSRWVASLAATTPEARRVRVLVLGSAEHFHSRRLNRDFNPLLFGAVRAASLALAVSTKGTKP